MASIFIISWNVRAQGLNSKFKRSLLFNFLKRYHPHICILQETHLTGSRVLACKKPWVGSYYHSTYSYSRGVTILVHKSVHFSLLDLHWDADGRYVVLHALCARLELVIVGVYIPSSANMSLIFKLALIMAQYPTVQILLTGDFNMPPAPSIDKLNFDPSIDFPLSCLAETYGLCDVWRGEHSKERQLYVTLLLMQHYIA